MRDVIDVIESELDKALQELLDARIRMDGGAVTPETGQALFRDYTEKLQYVLGLFTARTLARLKENTEDIIKLERRISLIEDTIFSKSL